MHEPFLSSDELQTSLNELAEHVFRPEGEAVTPMIVFVTHQQKADMQKLSMDASAILQRWLSVDIKRWQLAKDERMINEVKKNGNKHC